MDMKNIIRGFISDEILKKEIDFDDNDSLFKRKILTSLDIVRLIMYLEDEHGYYIKPSDITVSNFESINQIGRYLEGKSTEIRAH